MTAPATDSLSGIVERLTKRERAALIDSDGPFLKSKYALSNITAALIDKGLLNARRYGQKLDPRFTRRGIAIRQHMEKES
jgi:hypothetical protein